MKVKSKNSQITPLNLSPLFIINRKGVTLPESLDLQEELVPRKELEEAPVLNGGPNVGKGYMWPFGSGTG